ncbi:hypothetical protein BJX96DRAFT_146608 [Aspergillus floccosus]
MVAQVCQTGPLFIIYILQHVSTTSAVFRLVLISADFGIPIRRASFVRTSDARDAEDISHRATGGYSE